MADIRTKDGREELRKPDVRDWPTLRDNWDVALDGLDIAAKAMRAMVVRRYFQEHEASWKPCYWRYDDAATRAEDEALAEWAAWVGSKTNSP